ncbi:hypothetical protein, partial [Salinimicrobium sp. WS361]|uniref:hypothetical protein n=1 Tax=Salinimicrobium sp. WS361 TaxID=3425123 RepID=UPI003D6DB472
KTYNPLRVFGFPHSCCNHTIPPGLWVRDVSYILYVDQLPAGGTILQKSYDYVDYSDPETSLIK